MNMKMGQCYILLHRVPDFVYVFYLCGSRKLLVKGTLLVSLQQLQNVGLSDHAPKLQKHVGLELKLQLRTYIYIIYIDR